MANFLRFPSVFYVEPTNACNLSCIVCPGSKSKKQKGQISFNLYTTVIRQLAHHGVAHLNLHLSGEPLLHPMIAEMVAFAKEHGIRHVRFATNATLLNEDKSRDLMDAGLDSLTLSMDSSSAERYCPDRKGALLIRSLDENILALIALKKRLKRTSPHIHLQIVEMEETQEITGAFTEKWEGIADSVTVKPLLSWAGLVRTPTRKQMKRLICINHLTQGVVQWDGNASFCCMLIDSRDGAVPVLGNAADSSLEEIFLGEKRMAMIEAMLRGNYHDVPCCQECPDWVDYLDRLHKICSTISYG